jgi:hypothetical protein
MLRSNLRLSLDRSPCGRAEPPTPDIDVAADNSIASDHLAERVEMQRRAAANGAPRTDSAKGKCEITASVEALQYKQRGDAYPDHAAEAEGQPVREVVEGKRQVGLGDHFVHDEVSC